jgi:hypothetical protein
VYAYSRRGRSRFAALFLIPEEPLCRCFCSMQCFQRNRPFVLGSQTKLWGPKTGATCGSRGISRSNESTATAGEAQVYCSEKMNGSGCTNFRRRAGGAGKGTHNHQDRAAAAMPEVSSPYPEVHPGCTGCRAHPGCVIAIATRADQDVEHRRGAEISGYLLLN